MNRRIALTGGIACGKSLVAKFLNELGVETIDADDIVHELIPDPAERRRIAKAVFGDEKARKELEARIHPVVKERIGEFLGVDRIDRGIGVDSDNIDSRISTPADAYRCLSTPNQRLRLAVIPLLFEAHWDSDYDIICCVRSGRDLQISRMMTTRGYTREEAEARLKAQMPVEEKAAKSHYVIENNGTSDELKSEVAKFVGWLRDKSTAIDGSREQSIREQSTAVDGYRHKEQDYGR